MSQSFYNKQWLDIQVKLGDIVSKEKKFLAEDAPPKSDSVGVFQTLATLYISYVQILRRLGECYDQIIHPQKRRLLRHVLDGTIGRMLEIKQELVKLELTDFSYFDDIITSLKLTPHDMEVPIPKYFLIEKKKAIAERERLLGLILSKLNQNVEEEVDTSVVEQFDDKDDTPMTLEEAVKLIQRHERARQGRMRAKFMSELRKQEEIKFSVSKFQKKSYMDEKVAAVIIQKMWRGMVHREMYSNTCREEMIFLGMELPPTGDPDKTPHAIASRNEEETRKVQEANEAEYLLAVQQIKSKVRDQEGPFMKETLMEQIRQWFIECRNALGRFPNFPTEEEGGSQKIFKEKDPVEVYKELEEAEMEKNKKDKKGKDSKKNKKDKAKDKKKKKEDEGWKMSQSNFVDTLEEGAVTYNDVWNNRDESWNFNQKYDPEIIRGDKRIEVEEEIRVQVDELMRQELKNLKLAIDKDKGKKSKKGGGKKKGKKGGKGKKGKKMKDITPDSTLLASIRSPLNRSGVSRQPVSADYLDAGGSHLDDLETWMSRTIESLYEELVCEGIIKPSLKIPLKDFIGDYSYIGSLVKLNKGEPQTPLADIRRLVTEYAILPLGSPAVHEKAQLTRAILLTGSSGTGKKMLVHAVCTETGANLFDLTATNIAGKYPGKDGLKLLLHMVFKVGMALQPSVIYIGDCEKMFKKKIPKTDPSDPKRLKKQLPKMLKSIRGEDRLLLIGTSTVPFEGDLKPITSMYQKIICIPRPDYQSRRLMWREMISKHGGTIRHNLDLSSLAKISDGYTPGAINSVCTSVLTESRIKRMRLMPLKAQEFVPHLAKIDPVYKEEEEAFKAWFNRTPLGKKRLKFLESQNEEAGDKKGKNAKKPAGKGKK